MPTVYHLISFSVFKVVGRWHASLADAPLADFKTKREAVAYCRRLKRLFERNYRKGPGANITYAKSVVAAAKQALLVLDKLDRQIDRRPQGRKGNNTPEATHVHKKKPGTTVHLFVWSHKEAIPGSDLNLSIHPGDVYYQTVKGEPTSQEKRYDVQMLGDMTAYEVDKMFAPLPGQEDYHKQLIETVTRINGT